MERPLEVMSLLKRAATVYPDRIGLVDEPHLGEDSLGSLTYRQVMEKVGQIL